jgi:hypothetical protein
MPKIIKWSGTTADTINEAEERDYQDFEPYDGPLPPRGTILACDVKRITAEQFKSGNYGVTVLAEVNETGSKAKYNGLAYWERIVDMEGSEFKIKQFLKAVGSKNPGTDWHKTAMEPDDQGRKLVVKFGNIRVEGMRVSVVSKNGRDQDGNARAEVARFVPVGQSASASASTARSAAAEEDTGDGNADSDEVPF